MDGSSASHPENPPKKPMNPFAAFMSDYRRKNATNSSAKDVAAAGAAQWDNMSEEERKVWNDLADREWQTYKKTVADIKAEKKLRNAQGAGPSGDAGPSERAVPPRRVPLTETENESRKASCFAWGCFNC